jgi:copper(I)-binding protein
MKRSSLTLAMTLLATAAVAQDAAPTVGTPWARATAGAGTTGAAYLTLTAHGTADRLTGASTPIAGMAELHRTQDDHGIMQMRPVDGLPLAPETAETLAPGGIHLMLMELKHPLKQGDSFPLTLTFEHAPPQTVQVQVKGPGAVEP